MNEINLSFLLGTTLAAWLLIKAPRRLQLSLAKHPSLRGHAKMSRLLARLLPYYEYTGEQFYACDGAPTEIVAHRRAGMDRLARQFAASSPRSRAFAEAIEPMLADVQFVNAYRVPFQFRGEVMKKFRLGTAARATDGVRIQDLDGNWAYDLSGSYGVNLFGYDFYKQCIDAGADRVRELGPVLGPYHPLVESNVKRLRQISQLDEVSFHMSGTEAVMQAVRLARYHTGRPRLVQFCGAYHGWWDGVQTGIGNSRATRDVFTLSEMSDATLRVLGTRNDIACVLVNPLQALHPNAGAPGDATLLASDRTAHYDRDAYTQWLKRLREVCSARDIVLIFDEVFLGFRLAPGGAQEYFGVRADMVTYGKTLGGGLPVGVVCGRADLMKRYRADRPSDICFARGTFNSHPYVMGAMHEFLERLDSAEIRASYESLDQRWDGRVAWLNDQLSEQNLPIRLRNMVSVCTVDYTRPSRYNWMLQYYLRAQGLALAWVGTGRFIFSHNYSDEDFREVGERIVAAARTMQADGWWWTSPDLSNRAIKRQVLKELISAATGRKPQPERPLATDQA
jgi:glutamate-1-semialdehyde 2,1-aminomutase